MARLRPEAKMGFSVSCLDFSILVLNFINFGPILLIAVGIEVLHYAVISVFIMKTLALTLLFSFHCLRWSSPILRELRCSQPL